MEDDQAFVVRRDDGSYCESIDMRDGDCEWGSDPMQARIFRGSTWREAWSDPGYTLVPYAEVIRGTQTPPA